MEEKVIKAILEGLGCARISTRRGAWVQASCPFGANHPGGDDRNPSFAVKINPDGSSGFFCYTCHVRGPMAGLVRTVEEKSNILVPSWVHDYARRDGEVTVSSLRARLEEVTFWNPVVEVNGVQISERQKRKIAVDYTPAVLPESDLDPFRNHTLESILYLRGSTRKLTMATIESWQLGWDPESRRIVIPIRNVKGELVAYSKRLYEEPGESRKSPKYLHSTGFKRDYVLFGEHLVQGRRKAYLVEGFFHVIWLYQCGYRAPVAVMGSYLSEIQLQKIRTWFDEVVMIADGDRAGRALAESVRKALVPDVRVTVRICEEGQDANDQSPEQLAELLGPPEQSDFVH